MAYYQKKKNGTYLVRVSNGIVNGKQIQYSTIFRPQPGATKRETEKSLHEFGEMYERGIRDGSFTPGIALRGISTKEAEMHFSKFITEKYYPKIEQKLSPNTVRFYKAVCHSFLIPSFGRMRLCDITYHELQRFIDFLAYSAPRKDGSGKIGLSPGSVKRYATVFRSIITEACRYGYLEENSLRNDSIRYPKQSPVTLEAYSAEEAGVFIKALETEPPMIRAMLMTALLIGLRRAEVVALQWNDVDFDENCIYIDKSAYKLKGQQQALKSPKSEQGYRCIFFPEIYRDELLSWKHEQQKIRETAGKGWREQGFIFTRDNGNMFSLYGLTDLCAWFEKKNSFRHLKLHGLRHTFDSLLCSKGIGMETIKELMGHKSVSTTEIYTHAMTEDKQKAAEAMNDILSAFREEEKDAEHAVESNA